MKLWLLHVTCKSVVVQQLFRMWKEHSENNCFFPAVHIVSMSMIHSNVLIRKFWTTNAWSIDFKAILVLHKLQVAFVFYKVIFWIGWVRGWAFFCYFKPTTALNKI